MCNNILDNPYDKAIEMEYRYYLSLIKDSDNCESIWAKSSILYYRLLMINYKYNVPNVFLDRTDDKLIYMMAGRIKDCTELLNKESPQVIAYNISQFIQKNTKDFKFNVSMPLCGFDVDLWQREYEELNKSQISFWINIAKNSKGEQSIWSDGVVLYMQLFQLRSLMKEHTPHVYKDDNLIYYIADIIKPQIPLLSKYSIEQVAYFIAETYDRTIKKYNENV